MIFFPLRLAAWFLPFAIYAASPFVTVWALKGAIKNGDVAAIDHMIEWDTVRPTLRHSLMSLATNKPVNPALAQTVAVTGPAPGLWKRVKSYIGGLAVDRMVDRYANASGLPALFSYGQTYQRILSGARPHEPAASLTARIASFWAQVRHVEFVTPTVFDIEVQDKNDPTRFFTGRLQFSDWRWKLTELYIHTSQNPLGRLAAIPPSGPLER
jgi:hypothetical protein